MLTSDELQKLSEEAETRARETRRANYINEHVHKPAILSSYYIPGWLFPLILVCSCLAGFVIWHDSLDQLVLIGIANVYGWVGLNFVISLTHNSYQKNRYQRKVRKAEAEFNELVRKENLEFHVTDWEYYKNS